MTAGRNLLPLSLIYVWHVEVCSAHSFLSYVKDFSEDVPTFVMRQREAPQVTVEVEADGNCFFRLYW